MAAESLKRRPISPSTREKCIKCTRKEVQFLDKWGRWWAAFYIVGGLAFMGMGGVFTWFVYRLVQETFANQGPPGQNLIWEGFALGMLLGFISACLLYKGGHHIVEGVDFFRGKPASRMLVEYHDTLVNLMHEQDGQVSCESETDQLQGSLSAVKSNR